MPFDSDLGYTPRRSGSPSKLLRRLVGRRGRWVVGGILAGAVVYYLSDWRGSSLPSSSASEWVQEELVGSVKGKEKAIPLDLDLDYIIDDHGDYYYPSYPNSSHIPSFDPDISLLPPPSDLFPEVDLDTFFRPPKIKLYPDSHLREIISEHPIPLGKDPPTTPFPEDAFVLTWKGEEEWNKTRTQGERVQYVREDPESQEEKRLRGERAEAVRRGFAHAWQAYKDHAWGE